MANVIESSSKQALIWLLTGGSLVTLFIWSNLADPFNAPKSWVLLIAASYLLGWLAFEIPGMLHEKVLKKTLVITSCFILSMFLAFLNTDLKFIGFFGETSRRTGFLTYFSFAIFLLAAAALFVRASLAKFDYVTLITGSLVGTYGFFQHFNIDFIKWNNPYNSVLSTLGNPDFAAAVMGIFLVLAIGIVLNASAKNWIRIWAAALSLLLVIVMYYSQIRQGFVASAIGLGVLLLIFILQKNRFLGLMSGFFFAVIFVFGIFGMLNKGPLAHYLYKESISLRGDYWRAAFRMFKENPLFGVGLDRYGARFGEYRDITQISHHGPNVMSNAAHSVPIQLAATGGIFVVTFFLVLIGFVLFRAITHIKGQLKAGNSQIRYTTIFAAWITYQAQSLISIDNVGIAIWGWILGGILIGGSIKLSTETISPPSSKARLKNKQHPSANTGSNRAHAQPYVSGLAVTLAIALVIPLFLADSAMRMSKSYAKPTKEQLNSYVTVIKKPLQYGLVEPHNKVVIASLLAEAGQIDEGLRMLQEVLQSDPRSTEALTVITAIYEQTGRFGNAIPYRQQMSKLDPLNQQILLKLGVDYKSLGNRAETEKILQKILNIDSKSPDAKQAQVDLG